jgi:methyltransferase (TIGR00027 family)
METCGISCSRSIDFDVKVKPVTSTQRTRGAVRSPPTTGTAETVAVSRALHLLIDGDPKILEDPLAAALLSAERAAALAGPLDVFQTRELRGFRALFLVRQRYVEDELAKATTQGIAQYVILGAGLDSFAFRRADLMQSLNVYEVDHSFVQQWKRRRLSDLGMEIPDRLEFIPVDFESQTLAEGLAGTSFRRDAPAFFSWLGVTQYLTEDAVLDTLRSVASTAAAGSQIVFQIILPRSMLSAEARDIVAAASRHAARRGEYWQTFLEPEALEERLREIGFTDVSRLDAAGASDRYLQGRTDGLWLPSVFELITATVGDDRIRR